MPTDGPLHGVRVLDLTHHLAGAMTTLVLADLGADVVKVERPGGEPLRALRVDGFAPFDALNRGKRSVVVDLARPEGAALMRDLMAVADVFAENFRPGTLRRLGLAYDPVASACPDLVYCSVSGYGPDADAGLPGVDLIAQALSGLLALGADRAGEPPRRVGVSIASLTSALLAASGVLAALADRRGGGSGRLVETSLLEAARWLTVLHADRPQADADGLSPMAAPDGVFATRDGWLAVSAADDESWRRLQSLLRVPGLADDRFATAAGRRAHHRALDAQLQDAFAREDSDTWLAMLTSSRIAAAPVLPPAAVTAPPIRLTPPTASPARTVRVPGADTTDALAELGISRTRLAALLDDHVIHQAVQPAQGVVSR
jgi:crotonobetainyl-CoA:carnitine CoA-transferase CaiB-like acyl-CoA transferase